MGYSPWGRRVKQQQILPRTYLYEKLSIIYLKFKLNWALYTPSGSPKDRQISAEMGQQSLEGGPSLAWGYQGRLPGGGKV